MEPVVDLGIQRAGGDADLDGRASTAGPAPVASDKDVDELARRLYDRIRLRLSRELLIDRERVGALTDLH